MCEDSTNFLSTDAWISAVNSAMTSKYDTLGGDEDKVREELKDKILELLQKRAESSTMCPSEAPRALHPETWRDLMDVTREVARQLALDGRIEITQKGRAVDPEAPLRGPIRLRLVAILAQGAEEFLVIGIFVS
ncbi:hypothetical protein M758_2G099300 [Ceratodon purpureus]|nr:hypothetical protein M758_2G099300 [Ceratodon purpureus]